MPSHPRTDNDNDSPPAAAWTPDKIRALGAITDVPTAGAIFGLSRTHSYALAHRGDFPVEVLRIAGRIRVPVARILAALGLPP